jgi:PAS domain S-box-containing protein
MTIKHISKLVSLTLAVIIIGFAVAVSWSLNHLNQAFASVEFFGQQKDKIFTQVSQPISNYLLTGEATTLFNVEQTLNQIKTDVEGRTNLSASLQAPFIGLIDDLQQNTMPELTAAGKLADPQALLINNERQSSQRLQKLLTYVKEAHSAPQPKKQLYLKVIGDSQAALINLARARQSFFTSRQPMSPDNINRPLQELIALADEIKKLPLLGVMKQKPAASNVLSFSEETASTQPEDKALEPISEIPPLLQHYSKDMELALRIAQDKITGQAKVNQQLGNLQQRLLTLEAELTSEYQHYEHLMFIIMAVCSLLIISAVLICIFGGARILRRVSDLESTMSNIAHTSDLSLRAEALHHDEIGSMARSFNSMVEKLQETSKLVRQKINDIQAAAHYTRSLLETSLDPLVTISEDGHITDVNSATERVTGIARDHLIGSDFCDYFTDPEKARKGYQLIFSQGLVTDYPLAIRHTSGKITEVLYNASVYRDDGGNVMGVFAAARDITELKKAEDNAKSRLNNLAHVTRLGLIGGMASGIAHEVNQPLAAIVNYAQVSINVINTEAPDLVKLKEILLKTKQQALRAGRIIHRMKEFGKSHSQHHLITDINALIHGATDLCMTELNANNVKLNFELTNDLPPVFVDQVQIEQVIINLIRNSIEVLQGQPPNQHRQITIHSHLTLDSNIQVCVKDNGPGIDKDQQRKILTPFYTTKKSGTGMGLSISRALIEDYGGTLNFDSEHGKGSIFYFTLPSARTKV